MTLLSHGPPLSLPCTAWGEGGNNNAEPLLADTILMKVAMAITVPTKLKGQSV